MDRSRVGAIVFALELLFFVTVSYYFFVSDSHVNRSHVGPIVITLELLELGFGALGEGVKVRTFFRRQLETVRII